MIIIHKFNSELNVGYQITYAQLMHAISNLGIYSGDIEMLLGKRSRDSDQHHLNLIFANGKPNHHTLHIALKEIQDELRD